jgi:hypothetical protein
MTKASVAAKFFVILSLLPWLRVSLVVSKIIYASYIQCSNAAIL